ncbi:MAG: glycogen/starch/alpha-glucan phosphorylase [Candidatus Omnitrophica bacterium]|nr:glycogen/starch/alpha-glucan phosphorylase [Candidatus Omnitrophota bacterium]MBU1524594.1 glycogen/starch/alpha-glucan phosphorylase [Candidatus Omnitrophota bacterium]
MEKDDMVIKQKGMTKDALKLSFCENQKYGISKDQYSSTINDRFWVTALTVRDRLAERWIQTQQKYHKQNVKRVYYLSMEFLLGRLLGNYTYNLGIENELGEALLDLGFTMEDIRDQELDAGLGNGGLGRLAACFLDSMATLGIPAHGYGIRFDYGMFHQQIKDGHQIELPDEWLRLGSPWEFSRPEYAVKVCFYGRSEPYQDKNGRVNFRWVDTQDVLAVPYDYPIPGYKNDVVNTLRLWAARGTEEFDFDYFKHGDYEQAVYQKISSEVISKVLYPNDDISCGRELRLKQEYFLTAAAISDIIRRFKSENSDLRNLPEKAAIQLNDTHPSLAIAELMRILLDVYEFDWDTAWEVTTDVFSYTNHTLMPEALECWPVELFERLLPRHLQIIYEINARFLNEVSSRYPGDTGRLRRMSIIKEGCPKRVRMSFLSIIASHSVNGVSKLHTELLKRKMFKDFNEFYPGKINNKTNGITQRRWLLKANPALAELITREIGDNWIVEPETLKKLLPLADDNSFCRKWQDVKKENKRRLADYIQKTTGIIIEQDSIFDVQVKRIHEYKRQLLFALFIISQYLKAKNEPHKFLQPRTFIVGGKAAPSYFMAKLTIKFINSIGDVINRDKAVRGILRVVFLENYRVSLAEKIFPASDLSEQISTAGTEASGTGNMKFMLNGALTVGTLDGANIEITEFLGKENIFIFGNTIEDIEQLKLQGCHPQDFIYRSPVLQETLELVAKNYFSPYQPELFKPILDSLYNVDPFFVCADFDSYLNAQEKVSKLYQNPIKWTKKSIINTAYAGYFSSDRTIREYAKHIWGLVIPGTRT